MKQTDAPTDEALVGLAKKGNDAAWAELLRRHLPPLAAHVSRLRPGPGARLIAEVALHQLRPKLSQLETPGAFASWAKAACARQAFADRPKRPPPWLGFDGGEAAARARADAPDAFEAFVRRHWKTQSDVFRALSGQLSPIHLDVLDLRAVSGFAVREVAEHLGVAAGTVGSRYAHAREQAAAALVEAGVVDARTERAWRQRWKS